MKAIYRPARGDAIDVALDGVDGTAVRARVGDVELALTVTPLGPGRFRLSDGDRVWQVCVDREGTARHVTIPGVGEARLERLERGARRREAGEGSLASPMPGTVVKVLVAEGDRVEKGQDLLVVEAMKMEIKVAAPIAGRVKSLAAREGERCDGGQILAEIEPESAE
ncbi:MAG: biotin/lipoyl-containing protein [bacterium]